MVLTIAEILVYPGGQDAFVAAYREGVGHISGTPGCQSVRLVHSVENPVRFLVIGEWASSEDYLRGFLGTERFDNWRAAISDLICEPPRVDRVVAVSQVPMAVAASDGGSHQVTA